MIVYPSDGLAAEINQAKILPLMKRIPGLKEELQRPRAFRSDRYNFSSLVSYYQGAGSRIISKSCKICIADECDDWVEPPRINNMKELDKRRRSYSSSIFYQVCSPTTENGKIWTEFLQSSQGYWHLRCKGCGKLTMRSCDTNNLQFESTYNEELRTYIVKEGSERLVCPICGYQHVESDKHWMNLNGDYVHKVPERLKTHPGYQCGALASQLPALSWSVIAQQALEAGKTADIEEQISFDTGIRGLPYKPRKISKDEIETLRQRHCWTLPPSLDNVELVFVTSDVMDSFISYAVWAWTTDDSLYLIDCGETPWIILDDEKRKEQDNINKQEGKPPCITLEDIIQQQFLVKDGVGIVPTFCVIDQGGHRGNEVKYFASKHKNVIMQKGTTMTSMNWRLSDNQQRLILSNEKFWKSTAIFYLYAQKNKQENYLWLFPEIQEEYVKQLRAMKPDPSSKWGDQPENWSSNGESDHLFDCLKYAYLAKDFALQTFASKRYRFGKAPSILRRFEKAKKKQEIKQQQDSKGSFWSI